MAYSLSPLLKPRFFVNATNKPLVGGKLYTYLAETTTPATTYSNDTGTPNTNPIILDANGECNLYLDDDKVYRLILKDANDVTYFDKDRVSSIGGGDYKVLTFNTIADLRLKIGSEKEPVAQTSGYYSAGDGGGNSFYWDGTSSALDNGGTIIKPTFIVGAGRWIAINIDNINVKQFGAKGDGITNDADAIQQALNTGKDLIVGSGNYVINKSLYIKTSGQKIIGLGRISMSAALGKPAIMVGAKDEAGTKSDEQVWRVKIDGLEIYGSGTRTAGSAGISLVSCSQCDFGVDIRLFHAGVRVDGVCIANAFYQPTIIQNTYGLYDPSGNPLTSDIQATVFFGGRIESNEREGLYIASPNLKFVGCVIEGNGLFGDGDGSTPEVTILASATSGSISFSECYMESLIGKSADSIISIAPSASKLVFITGGTYFGSNDKNKFLVKIKPTASTVVGVMLSNVAMSSCINYVSGVISGNSRVCVVNCFPDVDVALKTNVTVGIGLPMIQQIDRAYWYTNQNVAIEKVTAAVELVAPLVTSTGTVNTPYVVSTSEVFGATMFGNFLQKRQSINATAIASPIAVSVSAIATDTNMVFKIEAAGRASSTSTHAFTARLVVNRAGGTVTIEDQQVTYNSKAAQTLLFSVDGSNNIVVTASSGTSLSSYVYRFFYDRFLQA